MLGRIALSLFMSPRPPPSRATQRSVALLSLVFVVSVGSGNAALRYIHISFAQSIGATAPLWTEPEPEPEPLTRTPNPLPIYPSP